MRRTPMELAALATAAVPGLWPVAVGPSPDDVTDFDSALLEGADGRRWRVRSPRGTEASARLETEMLVLRAFGPGVRAELPFQLPAVAGTFRIGELTTCVYTHLAGTVRELDELAHGGDRLVNDIGGALAAIHSLPHSLVDGADLPAYSANEFRQRRLNELDQAATTGKIPPILLRRWENALEDVSMWRFNPTVVHGDLHEDNLLVDDGRITAVTGWTDLRVGDPADDLAWLVASNEPDFVDSVISAYHQARNEPVDPHLLRRASLAAEFALAQYLVKALALGDSEATGDGEDMLAQLAADIEAQDAAAAAEQEAARVAAEQEAVQAAAQRSGGTVSVASPSVTVIPMTVEEGQAQRVTPVHREDHTGEMGRLEEQQQPVKATAAEERGASSKNLEADQDDRDVSATDASTNVLAEEPPTDAIPLVEQNINSEPTR